MQKLTLTPLSNLKLIAIPTALYIQTVFSIYLTVYIQFIIRISPYYYYTYFIVFAHVHPLTFT